MVSFDRELKVAPSALWLWPNVLSLDAPCVAVCWQWSFARSAGTALSPPLVFGLATAVWSIYIIDRIFDGPETGSPRHTFAALHRRPLLRIVALVNGIAAVALLPFLQTHVLIAGLLIAFASGWYLIAAQGVLRGRSSKRLAMALLFGAGVVLPFPISSSPMPALLATAFVVWSNTKLIENWDHGRIPSQAFRFLLLGGGLALACLGGFYFQALALGCWLMLALDIASARFDANLRRGLADAALVVAVLVVRATSLQ